MKTAHKVVGAVTAAVLLATPLVANFEGIWTTAKIDYVGTGHPPTVCYGETEGVKVGDKYTKEQCLDMLSHKLPRYAAEIAPCIHVPISNKTRASLISFAYNVGTAGVCHSGTVKLINAGHPVDGCNAMMAWNRAGGRVVQGLTNRRTMERKLCLEGLKDPVDLQPDTPVTAKNVPLLPAAQVVDTPTKPVKKAPVKKPPVCQSWGWFQKC
jgi:lysozyme